MMAVEPVVIGAGNPRLKRLRRLVGRARVRRQERAFVVEGPTLVAEALRSGLPVEELFTAPGSGPLGGDVAEGAVGAWFEVEASVLAAVLDPVTPRPVAAVVAAPSWTMADLAADRPLVVAVELRDPGNLGSLIRSVEGSGVAGLVLVGDTVDPLSPKVVRSSAGSVLRVPVVRQPDLDTAIGAIRSGGWRPVATTVERGATPYDAVDLRRAAVLLGNEPHGLPAGASRLADESLTIPLAEPVESLNVAAVGAIVCFEAARQQRNSGPGPKSDGPPTTERSGL